MGKKGVTILLSCSTGEKCLPDNTLLRHIILSFGWVSLVKAYDGHSLQTMILIQLHLDNSLKEST